MSIKPPRKNKTETLIGPSNYLNIAQGNRLPVERATNVINTLIQNKILKDEKTENYQLVVPSTWNASPRDPKGQRSAYEEALIGTPVADPNLPLEIIRTIHSFDPCLACAVHLYDSHGNHISKVSNVGSCEI